MDNKQEQVILQLVNKRQFLLEESSGIVLDILSREENQRILNGDGNFRVRHYTPLKTLTLFIEQVLSPDKSCNNAVAGLNIGRLVTEQDTVCPNTGSYAKARKRLAESTIHKLVQSTGRCSLEKILSSWSINGRDLKAFDGTVLTAQDTQANAEQYPKHSNKKQSIGNPQVRLLVVFSLITGCVVDYALEATKGKGTGELSLLRSILDCINEGDIAVGDALFCNYFLTHDLIEKKVDFIAPGHVQRCYDFNEGLILGDNDHIIEWKRPRRPKSMSKELYKKYPRTIQIREFKVNGIVYITTLKDASLYPKKVLRELYQRRWDAELHLRSLKTIMGMDTLSCQTPDMVRKEIGVHLLAYNIIRDIMVGGCLKGGAEPTKISFKKTLQLVNQVSPRMNGLSNKKKLLLYSQMLLLIVKNKVGTRPGRVEPRAIRRRPQSFPVLKTDRNTEKEKILIKRAKWLDEFKAA